MAHGVEPRDRDTHGPIPSDIVQLRIWWTNQGHWAEALDLCVKRKRLDAIVCAGQCLEQWQGKPWAPSHDTQRWLNGHACRSAGLEVARAMLGLAPGLVEVGSVGDDGMLRPGLLVVAARADRADVVDWMMGLGANTGQADTLWPHVAHIAAANNSVSCLDLALARDPGVVSHANAKGRTPLHVAAGYGHQQAMARLLDAGADARARDHMGRTPLAALMTGHREVSGWNNNTARDGWQAMAVMLICQGEGPEQHYGKTARAGTLVERVAREVSEEIAGQLADLGRAKQSKLALDLGTPDMGGERAAQARL